MVYTIRRKIVNLDEIKISINFKQVPPQQAQVHVLDRGFLYGDGIYEVIRTYQGRLYTFKRHFQRLQRSARSIYMELPCSEESLARHLREMVAQVGAANCYLRVVVTRGLSEISIEPPSPCEPMLVVIAKPLKEWPASCFTHGVRLMTPEVRRNPKAAMDPMIKSGNYLNCVLASFQAKRAGFDDALIVGTQGQITEATLSNIFFVKNSQVLTPSLESGILDGITRGIVLELCQQHNISHQEKWLTMEDVRHADESFLTSTSREVMGVCAINEQRLPVPGPVTKKLHSLYQDFIQANLDT